jgi:hypothetical protein
MPDQDIGDCAKQKQYQLILDVEVGAVAECVAQLDAVR